MNRNSSVKKSPHAGGFSGALDITPRRASMLVSSPIDNNFKKGFRVGAGYIESSPHSSRANSYYPQKYENPAMMVSPKLNLLWEEA